MTVEEAKQYVLGSKYVIAECYGGSHMYGLDTPESDIDIRGVYVADSLLSIYGFDNEQHASKQDSEADVYYNEVTHYLHLLRKANSQAIELLFADGLKQTAEFQWIKDAKHSLIDSERSYFALKGYIQSERKLATGERTGLLGSIRKGKIEQYGFSPKNFVQLLRLSYCGKVFLQTGNFVTNVMKHDKEFGEQLLDIKTHPEKYTKEGLLEMSMDAEAILDEAYEKRNIHWEFNPKVAGVLLHEIYEAQLERIGKQ